MRADGSPRPRDVVGLVRRLEECVAARVADQPRVALAYSGGLASTLVAMVARKRCDLDCVVAGADGSADLRAASEASRTLDVRITTIVIRASDAARILEHARSEGPRLSPHVIRSALPVLAVREWAREGLVLTGFGAQRGSARTFDALRRRHIHSPLAETAQGRAVSRPTLRAAATSLGLPDAWAQVRHRGPAEGAGLTSFLVGSTRDSDRRTRSLRR